MAMILVQKYGVSFALIVDSPPLVMPPNQFELFLSNLDTKPSNLNFRCLTCPSASFALQCVVPRDPSGSKGPLVENTWCFKPITFEECKLTRSITQTVCSALTKKHVTRAKTAGVKLHVT